MKKLQLFVAACAAALAASAAALEVKKTGGIEWACGGAGEQDRIALKDFQPQATASLMFVTEKRGGYLADVDFVVRDQRGGTVLQGRSDGPICLFNMPAGRYRVEASFEGARRVANLQAARTPGKPVRAVLTFPRDPAETIAPSPEEKAGVLVK